MTIKFCTNCGHKFEYKYSPPKFCSNCGEPIGEANNKITAKTLDEPMPARTNKKISALNEDETDAEYVPQINKLEFEIEDYGQSLSLGDIFGQPTARTVARRQVRNLNQILDGRE
jgi:predicted  nucleic acid-binding Zn-ribbon protein